MPVLLWLFVALRIVANPFANVFQKVLTRKAAHPFFIILATHALLSIVCVPLCFYFHPRVAGEFWLDILLCAVLAVAGNSCLVAALRLADLSVLGPINAYKSVVSLVPAMLLLGEIPNLRGLCGIALIVGGSYFLVDPGAAGARRNLFLRFITDRGIQYRFAALTLAAIEAVFLKRALLAATPLIAFLFWCVLGLAVALPAVALLAGRGSTMTGPHEEKHNSRGTGILPTLGTPIAATQGQAGGNYSVQLTILKRHPRTYIMLALSTGIMQLCTLLTLQQIQVGYTLALFQISTLLSVFLGRRVFHEPQFFKRLCGSAVMICGALLIMFDARR